MRIPVKRLEIALDFSPGTQKGVGGTGFCLAGMLYGVKRPVGHAVMYMDNSCRYQNLQDGNMGLARVHLKFSFCPFRCSGSDCALILFSVWTLGNVLIIYDCCWTGHGLNESPLALFEEVKKKKKVKIKGLGISAIPISFLIWW